MSNHQIIRILYIEDDLIVALLVREVLEQNGYHVDLATDGEEGLAKLQKTDYDVVVVDYQLPSMNGLQVLGTLAKNNLQLPAVMITGAGSEKVAVEAMKLGAGDYVVKDDGRYLGQLPFIIKRVIDKQKQFQEKNREQQHLQEMVTELLGQTIHSDNFLYQVIDNINAPILVKDENHRWIFLNNAVCKAVGFSKEQLLGKSDEMIFSKEQAEIIWEKDEAVLETGKSNLSEEKIAIGDNHYTICNLRNRYINPTTGKKYVVSIVQDVTQRKIIEESLRKERDFNRAVLSTVGSLVIVLDCQGCIVSFNRACEELTGYTATDVQGLPIWNFFVAPDELEAVQGVFTKLKSGHFPNKYQNHWLTKTKQRLLIEWSNTALVDDGGQVEYVIATGIDITERKRNEQALKASEQALRAILNATTDSILLHELNGTIVAINPTGAARLQSTPEKLMGRSLHEIFSLPVATKRQTVVERIVQTKKPIFIEDERDGIYFESNSYPVFNELGEVVRVAVFARDVTARKLAERAVRNSEKKYRTIINSTSEGFWLLDPQTQRIAEINDSLCRMLGYQTCEMVGKPLVHFVSELRHVLKVEITSNEIAVRKNGERTNYFQEARVEITEHQTYETTIKQCDGQNLFVSVHSTTVRDPLGNVLTAFAFLTDLTQRKSIESKLERTLHEQQAILNNSRIGIAFINAERRLIHLNKKLAEIFGYTESELHGQKTKILYPSYENYAQIGKIAYNLFTEGKSYRAEQLMRRKTGELFYCHILSESIDSRNLAKGYIWTVEDITEQKRAEENLRLAATVFETATEAIFMTNADNQIVAINPAFTAITGYPEAEVLGRDPKVLQSGRHDAHFYATMWESLHHAGKWQGEVWNRRKNGEVYPQWLSIATIRNPEGEINQYVAIFSDITERKRDEALIYYQANFDTLTDLPNRALFMERLEQEALRATRENTAFALMFIDLDHFKWVNDNLGHHAGDILLQEVAQRLKKCVRTSDTVARLAGDEFTILLPKVAAASDIEQSVASITIIAERIRESLAQVFILEGREVFISGSIGITLFPHDGTDIDTLICHADIAMYHAKETGRNAYQFFTADMNAHLLEQQRLESALRRALEHGEFVFFYQPIISLNSERIIGCEALLRWNTIEGNLLLPSQFLGLAETTGLLIPIGQWGLVEVVEQLKQWREKEGICLQMSINLSSRQLKSHRTFDALHTILEKTKISPSTLVLEIDENFLLENTIEGVTLLNSLKELGVQIAVDNFDSGYSFLSYVKHFPIDILKIDRSFIANITTDSYNAAHVEMTISLAHRLNIIVIAEGVETQEQLDFLRFHNCDRVQGKMFSMPLPVDEFKQYILHEL